MHFMIFANFNKELMPQRPGDAFAAYVRELARHPDVNLLHGGPTQDDNGEANGTLMVVEAPSIDAARAFVAESPFGQTRGLLEDLTVRSWDWMTGRPG